MFTQGEKATLEAGELTAPCWQTMNVKLLTKNQAQLLSSADERPAQRFSPAALPVYNSLPVQSASHKSWDLLHRLKQNTVLMPTWLCDVLLKEAFCEAENSGIKTCSNPFVFRKLVLFQCYNKMFHMFNIFSVWPSTAPTL